VTSPSAPFVPDIASVGAILRARTRDTNGAEVGTFNEETRPTGDQVLSNAHIAADGLLADVGLAELPAGLVPVAQQLIVYKTAALIELSFFPEQVATGRSPYPQLIALYDAGLKSLRAAVESAGGDVPDVPTDGEGGTARPDAPAYVFPVLHAPLEGVLGLPLGTYAVPWSGGLYQ
jgi:hypothetical protein